MNFHYTFLDELNALYVAVTRATDELHIHFRDQSNSHKKSKEINLVNMSTLLHQALIEEFTTEELIEVVEYGEAIQKGSNKKETEGTLKIDNVNTSEDIVQINLINKEEDEARREGTLIHTIFEEITSVDEWSIIKQRLLLQGEAEEKELDNIFQIVHKVLNIPLYNSWLNDEYEVFTEMEILSDLEGKILRARQKSL